MSLERLYDDLARWQWRRRARVGLALRKRLLAAGGAEAGTDGDLDQWLLELLDPPDGSRVLDVGCGFGATLLGWAGTRSLSGTGLTISGWQADRAREEVARRGMSDRVKVHHCSYDDPGPGPWDVYVAVESLFHSPVLSVTLGTLGSTASPAARFLLLEDMAEDPEVAEEPDAKELCARWRTRRLWTRADYEAALAAGGWSIRTEHDLTARVPISSAARLGTRHRRIRMVRALAPMPSVRRLCDAFLGGIALERLYARGRMSYRVLIADRSPVEDRGPVEDRTG